LLDSLFWDLFNIPFKKSFEHAFLEVVFFALGGEEEHAVHAEGHGDESVDDPHLVVVELGQLNLGHFVKGTNKGSSLRLDPRIHEILDLGIFNFSHYFVLEHPQLVLHLVSDPHLL